MDDALESLLEEDEKERALDPDEWSAYRDGEERLVDLLDDAAIEQLLDERDASINDG